MCVTLLLRSPPYLFHSRSIAGGSFDDLLTLLSFLTTRRKNQVQSSGLLEVGVRDRVVKAKSPVGHVVHLPMVPEPQLLSLFIHCLVAVE